VVDSYTSDRPPADAARAEKDRWDADYLSFRSNFLRVLNTQGEVSFVRFGKAWKFQGMYINGGRCRFEYEYESSNHISIISMNGDETFRFLDGARQLLNFITQKEHGFHPLRVPLCNAVDKWHATVQLLRKMVHVLDDKKNVVESARQFVQIWVNQVQGRVTHYMHLLHDHPDWFFNYVDETHPDHAERNRKLESIAWWTTQALEAAHGVRKRVFRCKTAHGKSITYRLPDGDVKVVREAAGIFQIFVWHWRVVRYRQALKIKQRGNSEVRINVGDLNILKCLGESGFLGMTFSESDLVRFLDEPEGTKLFLQGRGELEIPIHVQVSKATSSAIKKVRTYMYPNSHD